MKTTKIILLGLFYSYQIFAQSSIDSIEFNTYIMRSTYKLIGENNFLGTGFIVGRESLYTRNYYYSVLVTAKHVLDGMSGDSMTINFRQKKGADYVKIPLKTQIRKNGNNLYTSHPTADVAVMYVAYPAQNDIELYGIHLFATDSILGIFNIHPGDELFVLGYPLGFESNGAGFPILRSGKIASYPIVPTKIYNSFLLDFEVYPGNSGGPVFVNQYNRLINHKLEERYYNFLVGIVSEEIEMVETINSLQETKFVKNRLYLAKIVPSAFILETINMLPRPK
jgi:S1-C subfamily serine protease